MDELKRLLNEIFIKEPLSVIISNQRDNGQQIKKIKIRPVRLKNKLFYQLESFTSTQAFHSNLDEDACKETVFKELAENFLQLNAHATGFDFSLKITKSGKLLFNRVKTGEAPAAAYEAEEHDKKKNYLLREGLIIPPLYDLGIFDENGKVISSKYDKYKQINKFLEILDDSFDKLKAKKGKAGEKDKRINIIDFGCGKSYLTFIIYYYFTFIKEVAVNIVGLDLKRETVKSCGELAEKFGYENLKFIVCDAKDFKPDFDVDIVISLHACDTATDYALKCAIDNKARLILCAPCCQKELNKKLKTDNLLKPLLKYGLLKARFASDLTDAVRANILENSGYAVDVLEFIPLEHSPKNLLIRGVLKTSGKKKNPNDALEILTETFNAKLGVFE